MSNIRSQFRAASSLCRRFYTTGAALAGTAVVSSPLVPEQSRTEEKDTVLPAAVLPEKKDSYAQVAGLVAPPAVLPNSGGGLKPGGGTSDGDTKDATPIQQSPGDTKGKRPNPLSVRFSALELEIVKAKARTSGCSTNSYIRAAALGSSYRPPCDAELKRILLGLARELTAQGNNLNQVARRLNTGIAPAMHGTALEALISSLKETLQDVRKSLARGGSAA